MTNKSPLLMQLEQPVFKHRSDSKFSKIRIQRFCIDNVVEKEAYEQLLDRMLSDEVKIITEESIYSQKNDSYYVVLKWGEKV